MKKGKMPPVQHIIDIIAERVIATIGIPPTYVPVTDALGCPHGLGDFTLDGSWHELDLSACVPDGASALNISLGFSCDICHASVFFRGSPETHLPGKTIGYTQGAFLARRALFVLPVDDTKTILYRFELANWEYIGFLVRGWWL